MSAAPRETSAMPREHHLPVTRTARFYTLGPASGAPKQLWIVCHGYGQLAARFISHFAVIDDGSRVIAAPEALSRFYLGEETGSHLPEAKIGATWMTREDRLSEIDDYIRYLDAVYAQLAQDYDLTHTRVIALGFSQGVATICRWVERGGSRVDEVVLWGGAVPPDMDLARPAHPLKSLHPVIVLGDGDSFATPAAVSAQQALLRDKGITYDAIRFTGGHRLDYDTLRALATRWGSRD
jgi:predicted esterase